MILMDAVITIRIPKEVQGKMRKYERNWSKEVRAYIESRLKALELADMLNKMQKRIKNMRVTSDSTAIIREYRDAR